MNMLNEKEINKDPEELHLCFYVQNGKVTFYKGMDTDDNSKYITKDINEVLINCFKTLDDAFKEIENCANNGLPVLARVLKFNDELPFIPWMKAKDIKELRECFIKEYDELEYGTVSNIKKGEDFIVYRFLYLERYTTITPLNLNDEIVYVYNAFSFEDFVTLLVIEGTLRNCIRIKICPTCKKAFVVKTRKNEIFDSDKCRKKWNNAKRDANPIKRKFESRRKMINREIENQYDLKKKSKLQKSYGLWLEKTQETFKALEEKYQFNKIAGDLKIYRHLYSEEGRLEIKERQRMQGNKKYKEEQYKEIEEFGKYLKDTWQQLKEDIK